MSSADRESGLPALEAAVGRAIEELRAARAGLAEARSRIADLEALLGSFEAGSESPSRMNDRLTRVEEENRDLRARIGAGRDTVERLIARIRFLEDQQ